MSLFSEKEKQRRFDAAQSIIKSEELGALLLLGNGMVGSNAYGAFRYFTDDRVFYYIQAAMFFPDSVPAAARGQSAVLYRGEEVLGGGIIAETL